MDLKTVQYKQHGVSKIGDDALEFARCLALLLRSVSDSSIASYSRERKEKTRLF